MSDEPDSSMLYNEFSFLNNSSTNEFGNERKHLFNQTNTTKSFSGKEFTSDYIYRNFLTLTIAFSLNHSCVVASLAYSSALLGNIL